MHRFIIIEQIEKALKLPNQFYRLFALAFLMFTQ